ncbi:hypothetical protein NJ76_05255 [Rhodococcus sp. IITR03]|nr:hypothetical protein NJ76_05255 [Rhodococcus sp. IITR03]
MIAVQELAGSFEQNAQLDVGVRGPTWARISCPPRCLRTTCTATAPDAVRTFRTNATARTYLLSVPIRLATP